MRPLRILLPLAYLPLFVGLPGFSFPLLHLLGVSVNRDSVNVSFSIAICMSGALAWFAFRTPRDISRYLWFSIAWLGLSLASGLAASYSTANILFYVQTLIPIFAMPFGFRLIRGPADIDRFTASSGAVGAIFVVILVVTFLMNYGIVQLLTDRIAVMKDVAYAIPQFKSYYPNTVLATFSFALSRYLFAKNTGRVTTLCLVLHGAFIPLCWSRAGLLGFGACMFIQLSIAWLRSGVLSKQRAIVFIALFSIAIPVAIAKLGSTLSSRDDVHAVDNYSDQKRLDLFLEGLDRIASNPLFGDRFIPELEKQVMGESVEIKRLFGAHNQFIDLALRGGVVYLVFFVFFLVSILRRCRRLMSRRLAIVDDRFFVVGAGAFSFLLATALGANFQLYFIQLQTATPFFMVLGIVIKADRLAMQAARIDHQTSQVRMARYTLRQNPGVAA